MICKYCNAENRDGAVFCGSCGRRIDGNVVCPRCGQPTPPGAYCVNCGATLETKKRCTKCGTVFTGDRCPVCNPVSNFAAEEPVPVRKKRCTKCGTVFTGDRCPVCNPVSGFVVAEPEPVRKKRCTKCGTVFTGDRCPVCYPANESVPAAEPAPIKKKRCTKCGTVFTGDRCPVCYPENKVGAPASRPGSRGKSAPGRPVAASVFARDAGRAENVTEDVYQRNEKGSLALAVVGLIGVAVLLAFTFLVGWTTTVELGGEEYYSERQNMYYFFKGVYDGISGRRAYADAVLGSVVTGGMMLAMTALAVLCVVRFVSSVRSGNYRPYLKYLVMTYLLYVAFALMFRSMISFRYEGTVSLLGEEMEVLSKSKFTWPVFTALAVGGALVGAAYVGGACLAYRRKPRFGAVKRYALPLAAAALLIVSVVLLSGIVVRLRYDWAGEDSAFSFAYGQGYLYWISAYDNQTVFTYAFFAELATCIYMPFAMMVATKLLTHVYNPGQKNVFLFELAISSVFYVAAVVFAALLAKYVYGSEEIMYDVFGEMFYDVEGAAVTRLGLLYAGAAVYAVAFALCVLHMVMKPQRPAKRMERIKFSNRIYG